MNKIVEMIEADIEKCNELIKKGFAYDNEVMCFVSKYKKIDSEFGNNLHNYVHTIGDKVNCIKNIEIIRNELEGLLLVNELGISTNNEKMKDKTIPSNITLNVNNSSNNNNCNTNTINITFDDIKEKIKNDNEIADSDKDEILSKIDEIKEIQLSSQPKKEKWGKLKAILGFLLDKGADFVITYLPQILLILQLGGING